MSAERKTLQNASAKEPSDADTYCLSLDWSLDNIVGPTALEALDQALTAVVQLRDTPWRQNTQGPEKNIIITRFRLRRLFKELEFGMQMIRTRIGIC